MDCSGNVGIDQSQAIITMYGCRLIRETKLVKRPIQPVTGSITCEDSSSAIATVSGRRQANDQKSRADWTEARNRPSPIFPFTKAANFGSGDFLSIDHQPRTAPAIDNLTLGR